MPTFRNIRAFDRIQYRTADGKLRTGNACPFLVFATHVIVDGGGEHGRPVIVGPSNYVRNWTREREAKR